MSPPVQIKQFSINQYDLDHGKTACTAIALVAGIHFLKSCGRTRKCLWNDSSACEIIERGVNLHCAWSQQANVKPKAMASPEELMALPEFSQAVTVNESVFGQYKSDTLGLRTLEQGIRDMTNSPQLKAKGFSACLFITQSHSTLVGIRRYDTGAALGHKFVVFDSHARDANGTNDRDGKAVTVRLANMAEMLAYLARLYYTQKKPDELFSLHEISLKSKKVLTPASDMSLHVRLPVSMHVDGKRTTRVECNVSSVSQLSSSADSDSTSSYMASSPGSTPAPPMSRLARQFTKLAAIGRRSSAPAF